MRVSPWQDQGLILYIRVLKTSLLRHMTNLLDILLFVVDVPFYHRERTADNAGGG